jgi:HEAT repeat protein
LDALSDPEASVRAEAASLLRALGRDAAPAIEALARTLDSDPEETVRTAAAFTLAELARVLPEEVGGVSASLSAALSCSVAETRALVTFALGTARSVPKECLRALETCLQDPDGTVRVEAVAALWKQGRVATAVAADTLLTELGASEAEIREIAARRVGGLPRETAGVQEALTRASLDPDPSVAAAARHALRRVRSHGLRGPA